MNEFLADSHTFSLWVSGNWQQAECNVIHAPKWNRSILGTTVKPTLLTNPNEGCMFVAIDCQTGNLRVCICCFSCSTKINRAKWSPLKEDVCHFQLWWLCRLNADWDQSFSIRLTLAGIGPIWNLHILLINYQTSLFRFYLWIMPMMIYRKIPKKNFHLMAFWIKDCF